MIEDVKDAFEMWEKLEKLYQDSGFTSRHTALQQLMTTTLSSCNNSVDTYAMTIRAKAKDLKKMNARLDDWVIVSVLLNNLDGKFKEFTHRIIVSLTMEPDF